MSGLSAQISPDYTACYAKKWPEATERLGCGIVKLTKIRLADPQDDGLESCCEPGMLGVGRPDSA